MRRRINTNDLRAFADTLPPEWRGYMHRVADELADARTQRNIARAEVRRLKLSGKAKRA